MTKAERRKADQEYLESREWIGWDCIPEEYLVNEYKEKYESRIELIDNSCKVINKYINDKYKHYLLEVSGSEDYWQVQHQVNVLRDKFGANKVHTIEINNNDGLCEAIVIEVY